VPDRTGLIVPVDDAEAMAGALARLLDDTALAARLGAALREHVATEFAVDRQLDRLHAVWQELAMADRSG
jgi:glycosyltransferase involved in cell wall biosynthesis